VYGLGADASNPAAVRRIFEAKGTAHRSSGHRAFAWCNARTCMGPRVSGRARRVSRPRSGQGPLTLILPRSANVSDAVTGGQDSVGLRVPAHPVAQALLEAFGAGIAAPSANRFGHVSPTRALHVADDLGDAVSLILDGGACDLGIESTIVAFTRDEPMLLRPARSGFRR
jgi:L-threonylcarbamoyladenylate synthase